MGYIFWVKNDYNFSYANFLEKSIEKKTEKKLRADAGVQILSQKKTFEVKIILRKF